MRWLKWLGIMAFLTLIVVMAVLTFHGCFDSSKALEAGDAPLYVVRQIKNMISNGHFSMASPAVGLGSLGPILVGDYTALFFWLSPETKADEYIMLFSCILTGLFMFLFLRDRRFSLLASMFGAIAIAFSTVTVSIAKAGHTGKFEGMAYMVAAMWAIGRGLRHKKFTMFLLGGFCGGMALAQARDMALIVGMGIAVFWVYDGVRLWREERFPPVRVLLPMLAAGLVCLGAAFPVAKVLFGSTSPEFAANARTEEENWEWATQWSLPSDELPKLLIPSYFGYDSWDTKAPYYGRMGRTAGWEQHKQGFRNFTQTNEYLGASVLVLALLGAVAGLYRLAGRRRPGKNDAVNDVPFWLCLGLLSLVLALGKYGFLYRIFYSLPMMSSIRNPVKFMHLVAISVCILSAHGVEAVLGLVSEKRKDFWAMARTVAPLVLLLVLLVSVLGSAPWDSDKLLARLAREGFGQQSDGIRSAMMQGLFRSCWFVTLVLIALLVSMFAPWKNRRHVPLICGLLLIVTLAWDLTGVNRRYISYYDPLKTYRSNAVMDYLKGFPEYRVKFVPHNQGIFNMWNSLLVPYLFVRSADKPAESRRNPDIQMFYDTLRAKPGLMWSIMGVRHMVLPRAYESEFKKMLNKQVVPVKSFDLHKDLATGGVAASFRESLNQGQFVILENSNAIAFPRWYSDAKYADGRDMFAALAEASFDPMETLIVAKAAAEEESTPEEHSAGGADVELVEYNENKVEVRVHSDSNGWLLFNDYLDHRWLAEVDGKDSAIYRADGIFMAVRVPAGARVVSLTFSGSELSFWVPLVLHGMLGVVFLGVGGARFLNGRRNGGGAASE